MTIIKQTEKTIPITIIKEIEKTTPTTLVNIKNFVLFLEGTI